MIAHQLIEIRGLISKIKKNLLAYKHINFDFITYKFKKYEINIANVDKYIMDVFDTIEKINLIVFSYYSIDLSDMEKMSSDSARISRDQMQPESTAQVLKEFIGRLDRLESAAFNSKNIHTLEGAASYLTEIEVLLIGIEDYLHQNRQQSKQDTNSQAINKMISFIETRIPDVIESVSKELIRFNRTIEDDKQRMLLVSKQNITNDKKLHKKIDQLLPVFLPLYSYLEMFKKFLPNTTNLVDDIIDLSTKDSSVTNSDVLVKTVRDDVELAYGKIVKIKTKLKEFNDFNYHLGKKWLETMDKSIIVLNNMEQELKIKLNQLDEAFGKRDKDYQLKLYISKMLEKKISDSLSSEELDGKLANEEIDSRYLKVANERESYLAAVSLKTSGSDYLSYLQGKLEWLDKNLQMLEDIQYKYMLLMYNDCESIDVASELNTLESLDCYDSLYETIKSTFHTSPCFKIIPFTDAEIQTKENCLALLADLKNRSAKLRQRIYMVFGDKLREAKDRNNEDDDIVTFSLQEYNHALQKTLDDWDITTHDKNKLFQFNEILSLRLESMKREELADPTKLHDNQFGCSKKLIAAIQKKISEELKK